MKTLITITIALVLLLAGLWFYASKLPKEVSQASSARIGKTQSQVWSQIRDISRHPEWFQGLRAVMPDDTDSSGVRSWKYIWTRKMDHGMVIHEVIPDTLVLEITSDRRIYQTRWTLEIESLPPDSTLLTLRSHRYLAAPFHRLTESLFPESPTLEERFLQSLK